MGFPIRTLVTPKRGKESKGGRTGWYGYYAGFSSVFVEQTLQLFEERGSLNVLDPWNGSGTTTEIAFNAGHNVMGFDLNPVMVIVAKARTLDARIPQKISGILDEILQDASRLKCHDENEPLEAWLNKPGANYIRSIERAIYSRLADGQRQSYVIALSDLASISPLASFFYVALFRLLKETLRPFRSSNPTWFKMAGGTTSKLDINQSSVFEKFKLSVRAMERELSYQTRLPDHLAANPKLEVASSDRLPVESSSVDVIITSPPYCTRIDYVVKTAPELAALGATRSTARALRDRMIGTPTIASILPEPVLEWGGTARNTLDMIGGHGSKAARTYYWKTYVQYFAAMYSSICEIGRTMRGNGVCFLVVQDSNFKNVRVDLASVMVEMAESVNWRLREQMNFRATRTIRELNTSSKPYGMTERPIESVLTFEKLG